MFIINIIRYLIYCLGVCKYCNTIQQIDHKDDTDLNSGSQLKGVSYIFKCYFK